MEFIEYPSVEGGIDRTIVFSKVKWLTKTKFLQLITENKNKKDFSIYPYVYADSTPTTTTTTAAVTTAVNLEDRIYVGKTIPKTPPTTIINGVAMNTLNRNGDCPYQYLELVGNVCKTKSSDGNSNETWKLIVTHNLNVYEIEDEFLILSIDDPNSFYWSSNKKETNKMSNYFEFNNSDVPKYAFRAAVDKLNLKYNYIGRTLIESDKEPKRPKYYANGWFMFDEFIPKKFGVVNRLYKLLFSPHKNLMLGFDQFETLCLKASPAPLKLLCRSAIRSYANYSQTNIKSINRQDSKLIPDSLINYLKYPSCLKIGEFMLKDEKLVKEDDRFELAFDKLTGNLVCRALITQEQDQTTTTATTTSTSSSDDKKQIEFVIAKNIDNIWLHKFQTIFYDQFNSAVQIFHSINDNILPYKFCIEWELASCQVRPLI